MIQACICTTTSLSKHKQKIIILTNINHVFSIDIFVGLIILDFVLFAVHFSQTFLNKMRGNFHGFQV